MKLVEIYPIGRGLFFKVDDDDYASVMKHKWYLRPDGYIVTVKGTKKRGQETVRLHRFLNRTPDGMFTDHISGDRFDNRKSNLRTVTKHQNNMNTGKKSGNRSGYLGVSWNPRDEKWRARLMMHGQEIWLGLFDTREEAAYVFDQAATQLRGEYARLNSMQTEPQDLMVIR